MTPAPPRRPTSQRARLISSIAMLAVAIGGVWFYSVHKTAQLFDLGVAAHVQCAVAADTNKRLPASALATMLGAQIAAAESGAELVAAGTCSAGGRDYTDVVLREKKALVSVAVTIRAEQELFPRALAGRVVNAIHMGDRGGYAAAAWESGMYLAYVVSSLPDDQNEQVALRVAPVINGFTNR
jgi:anti-sigma factor RsiW